MGSLQIFVVGSGGAQRCIRQQCKFNMTGGGKRKENESFIRFQKSEKKKKAVKNKLKMMPSPANYFKRGLKMVPFSTFVYEY